jgi:hypothetical protein
VKTATITVAGILSAAAITGALAGPANAAATATTIPSGIEVAGGCYQTVGSYIHVEPCNFGIAAQRYEVVLITKVKTGEYMAEITQGSRYLDIGPGHPKATVAMSTYSDNSYLYIHAGAYGADSTIERWSGRLPAEVVGGIGSTVTGTTSGDAIVGFADFDGVQV